MKPITAFLGRLAQCLLFTLLSALLLMPAHADQTDSDVGNQFIVTVLINGQKAHLFFDTSADTSILFRKSADKLGVKTAEPSPGTTPSNIMPGRVQVQKSEPFQLTIGDANVTTTFKILDTLSPMGFDGALSWSFFQNKVIKIDGPKGAVFFLEKLPEEVEHWPHWKLVDRSARNLGSKWLGFLIPGSNQRSGGVYIDTGAYAGISLSQRQLQAWKTNNPHAAGTMDAYYYRGLNEGPVIREEFWATQLKLADGLTFSNVAIALCAPPEEYIPSYVAKLGMFAISQLDIIVDVQNRVIYIKPAEGRTNAPYYNYNRIGAVFEPQSRAGGDLIAHVFKDSPAYEAGVRDGDVLTKIGTVDAAKLTTDPRSLPLGQFWSQPAGTKINIECRRGEETLKFAITLKEIFPQAPPSKDASQ
jgi:hypothetical protein